MSLFPVLSLGICSVSRVEIQCLMLRCSGSQCSCLLLEDVGFLVLRQAARHASQGTMRAIHRNAYHRVIIFETVLPTEKGAPGTLYKMTGSSNPMRACGNRYRASKSRLVLQAGLVRRDPMPSGGLRSQTLSPPLRDPFPGSCGTVGRQGRT